MILSSNGGKSDAWAGQERGRTTIACIQTSEQLNPELNKHDNEAFRFKTPKSFYSYLHSVSAKLRNWVHAKSRSVIPALAGAHEMDPVSVDCAIWQMMIDIWTWVVWFLQRSWIFPFCLDPSYFKCGFLFTSVVWDKVGCLCSVDVDVSRSSCLCCRKENCPSVRLSL